MGSDSGSEFKNIGVYGLSNELEMKHGFSTKYTPQSSGLAKRKNRTLVDMSWSMLSEYGLSDAFWAEAINVACHASNMLYCYKLLKKNPYELYASNMLYYTL